MKIEFAVQMTCESCVKKVQKSLSDLNGISNLDIDLSSGTVVVDTELPQSIIKDKIETTGMRAVLKGYGQMGAAVAMLGGDTGFSSGNVKGVIRFVQEEDDKCLIDGEIESPSHLHRGPLTISIYECGDISNNCSNLGKKLLSILNQNTLSNRINSWGKPNETNGFLNQEQIINNHEHNEEPHGVIVKTKHSLKVGDIIGRSLVVEDRDSNKVACAVIARSAGVRQNKKVICACDGVTLWEERERPLAGPGRRGEGMA